MICYKDKTFCAEINCVAFGTCHRALTDDAQRRADDAGLDVAVFDEAPDCFEEVNNEKV